MRNVVHVVMPENSSNASTVCKTQNKNASAWSENDFP